MIILLRNQPHYEARQDPVTGEWHVLEDGRLMAKAACEADARFLAQAAAGRRSSLIQPIGPMLVIPADWQN